MRKYIYSLALSSMLLSGCATPGNLEDKIEKIPRKEVSSKRDLGKRMYDALKLGYIWLGGPLPIISYELFNMETPYGDSITEREDEKQNK